MRNWNYRVMAHEDERESYFSIHTVYYDENDKPKAFSETEARIISEDFDDLKEELNRLKLALDKPILSINNFPEIFELKTNK